MNAMIEMLITLTLGALAIAGVFAGLCKVMRTGRNLNESMKVWEDEP